LEARKGTGEQRRNQGAKKIQKRTDGLAVIGLARVFVKPLHTLAKASTWPYVTWGLLGEHMHKGEDPLSAVHRALDEEMGVHFFLTHGMNLPHSLTS
jgi:ADP-ribose pyrophosphatase YjhB (NUDIX family)